MAQAFGTLFCFSSKPFLKQLVSHVSAATLSESLKVFFGSVNERQVTTHEKIERHDEERVSLIYCFNSFRNQL